MDGVEPGLVRLLRLQDFFQREAFPGCAQLGMRQQAGTSVDAAEGVEEARVAEVDLRSLDEALVQVGLSGKQAADHVGLLEGVQIRAGGVGRDAQ